MQQALVGRIGMLPPSGKAGLGEEWGMRSRSVVVTGAAGFVGSHLTDRCLSLGWRVYAIDAFTPYYDEALKRRNLGSPPAPRLHPHRGRSPRTGSRSNL